MNSITEMEKRMYGLMGKLQESNAPIIFKGALITKLVLADNNYSTTTRATQDMDMNWVCKVPNMEEMRASIESSGID